ncbi:MAG: glutamyl-tRNA amidotransferase [Candidatus Thiodiazotropha sp. (ex Notomyrtea botanica)]|nr:glutamyl-tRNA amidotransferase [Candidatus Thiodiazotropha sp. (ex Notomyrtea botanica)]MCU7828965.1 glutamyl-tRNA amidotransferase [Candidatus Thiodiazotropha sp. (ex Myrtea sp. 'scaly one' KF741663)]
MKKILPLLFPLLLLTACQTGEQIDMSQVTPKEKNAVESLLWLKQANAENDARQNLDRGDKRLLAMATRGSNIPGVAPELMSKAKSVCGVRYLPGSTDMVMGETHLKLLQAAEAYAENYNRLVIDHCL